MSDAFEDAFALLAAAADVKGFEARITRLKKLSEQVAAEQAQLEAARIANERAFAEATADLDRRRSKIAQDEVELRLRRDAFDQREARRETSSADPFPFDPNFGPGTRSHTGLAREKHHE
jgi:hypothetical protein